MKKAKIMLTAIAVLAVVGGALAFKANSFGIFTAYTCDTDHGFVCKDAGLGENVSITLPGEGEVVLTNATATNVDPENAPCNVACPFTLDLNIGD